MTAITFEETKDGKLYIKLQLLQSGYGEEKLIKIAKGTLEFVLAEFDISELRAFSPTLRAARTGGLDS